MVFHISTSPPSACVDSPRRLSRFGERRYTFLNARALCPEVSRLRDATDIERRLLMLAATNGASIGLELELTKCGALRVGISRARSRHKVQPLGSQIDAVATRLHTLGSIALLRQELAQRSTHKHV